MPSSRPNPVKVEPIVNESGINAKKIRINSNKITIDGASIFAFTSEKLRNLRESRGLTQGEVAQKLGLSRSAVGSMESGNQGIPLDNLLKCCQLFDLPLGELVPPELRELIVGPVLPPDRLTPEEIQEFRRMRGTAPKSESPQAV